MLAILSIYSTISEGSASSKQTDLDLCLAKIQEYIREHPESRHLVLETLNNIVNVKEDVAHRTMPKENPSPSSPPPPPPPMQKSALMPKQLGYLQHGSLQDELVKKLELIKLQRGTHKTEPLNATSKEAFQTSSPHTMSPMPSRPSFTEELQKRHAELQLRKKQGLNTNQNQTGQKAVILETFVNSENRK